MKSEEDEPQAVSSDERRPVARERPGVDGDAEESQLATDRTLSAFDRATSALDQTASDSDQTASDADQTASERDQSASDQDQAASDEESAAGADQQVRDAGTAQREQATQLRGEQSRARVNTGVSRDVTADERDQAAAMRDGIADVRDAGAQTQTQAQSLERSESGMRHEQSARAAHDRRRAADDRARAATERAQSARDRVFAARDRAQAALDREASETDELTHVRRRGAGLQQLQREIDRARRGADGLVVTFVDVDGLKRVNDTDGHLAGDALLVAVAAALRRCLRSYDLIMRFGGDEFVCALPDADVDGVRRRFAEVSELLATAPNGGSISVGFARLEGNDSAEQLIGRADSDLLARRGR
jgi:diguanylate cyclase (GGDEF)-like protein